MQIRRVVQFFSLTAIVTLMSCGVNQQVLDESEKKLGELKLMGVPDSALSKAKVYLYQTKDALQASKANEANSAYDSLKYYLTQAETMFKDNVTKLLPEIEALKTKIAATKSHLSGLNAKKIDSLMVPVDSFLNIKWILNANALIQDINARLPQFEADQAKSDELRKSIPGQWICENITKSTENKAIHAVEKKIFNLEPNGIAKLIENKKGQSGPYLKEDYEFVSNGKWDLLGDTLCLFIDRFAAVRQNFERLYVENKKKLWKNEPQPTYDSAITDGSQNRFITYADLKEDFKQVIKK